MRQLRYCVHVPRGYSQGAIFTKENRKITSDTPFEREKVTAFEDIFSIGMMVDQQPPPYRK